MKQICIVAPLLMFAMLGGCQGQQKAEQLSSEEVGEQTPAGLDSGGLSEEATPELTGEQFPTGSGSGSVLEEAMPELVGEQSAVGLASGGLSEETTAEREPDVIYVPAPNDVVDMMLHLARVTKEDVLYDLGCGDGRIVVAAAKKYGCKAVGFDIDPERVQESLENVKENRVNKLVTIEQKDIFTLDLRPASVITLYLLPSLNVKLIPQLEQLEPGCRIVSHDFDMRGVKPDAILTMDSEETGAEHAIYLWTTPLKKEEEDYDDELSLWQE